MLALTFLRRFPRWKRCTCLVARSNTPYDDDTDIVDTDIVDTDIVDEDIVDKDADDADVDYRDVDHNYSLKGDISIAEAFGTAFQYIPLSLNHIQSVELIHKYDV